ncbi:MAG TPA: hypothetical protein VJ728_09310, partial [Candidatus Binataceae bacterium]|nr:hypothetical protein [Candidatus Binataceae bacterium]
PPRARINMTVMARLITEFTDVDLQRSWRFEAAKLPEAMECKGAGEIAGRVRRVPFSVHTTSLARE